MTNIQTIDSHVLLPHQADWLRMPSMKRIWRSRIDSALAGQEDRGTFRQASWIELSYDVVPFNHVERARFEERARAALKACKCAVPHWGAGTALALPAEAEDTDLVLDQTDHGLSAGDTIFVQSTIPEEFDIWDTCVLSSVNGVNLTLGCGLLVSIPQTAFVWPLLLGKPAFNSINPINDEIARFEVTVQFDRRPRHAVSQDDFLAYPLGIQSESMSAGEGWDGPWVAGAGA